MICAACPPGPGLQFKSHQQAAQLSQSQFLEVFGRRIEYRRFEPPAAAAMPAIVMLHEGLGSVGMWKDFPLHLAAITGARVVAYSRFGYGRSDPPPRRYGALEMHRCEALEVLPEILRRLQITRPTLFGHSDGASIALIYGAARPCDVSGLVLLAPHVFVEPMCLVSIENARQAYLTTDLRQKLLRYHQDPDQAFRLWNDLWLHPQFREWTIEGELPAITCPVLAVQGYQDEYGTMEQLERIARAIPRAEQLRLEGCRHSPHRDQPARVLESTARWLSRRVGAQAANPLSGQAHGSAASPRRDT